MRQHVRQHVRSGFPVLGYDRNSDVLETAAAVQARNPDVDVKVVSENDFGLYHPMLNERAVYHPREREIVAKVTALPSDVLHEEAHHRQFESGAFDRNDYSSSRNRLEREAYLFQRRAALSRGESVPDVTDISREQLKKRWSV